MSHLDMAVFVDSDVSTQLVVKYVSYRQLRRPLRMPLHIGNQ